MIPRPWEMWAEGFGMYNQKACMERAEDDSLDGYLRIFYLALARHRRNGHAKFERGDIGRFLGTDFVTGEVKHDKKVAEYIKAAVKRGLLTDDSGLRCLVVAPPFYGGSAGRAYKTCDAEHGFRKRRSKSRPK